MGSAVRFILLFSGLWAQALCASRQFYRIDEKMNWTNAQKYCRENHTDLATIEDEKEMDAVKDVLNGRTDVNFWIGLRQVKNTDQEEVPAEEAGGQDVQTSSEEAEQNKGEGAGASGLQSNRTFVWSDNTTASFTNWAAGEPNNKGTDNCVEVNGASENKTWNDANCSWPGPFVCYKSRTPLIMINETKTWHEALRYCRRYHLDLFYIDSLEMQNWVEEATKHASSNMWIGLRHTCTLGFWYWVTGEMICFQNWAPGNGTGVEDCSGVERTGALLSESKKWVSLPQTDKLPFICTDF